MLPMRESVLCVGAGAPQVPLLQEAKALGLCVIATDGDPQAPGVSLADAFYHIDTYDLQKHIDLIDFLRIFYPNCALRGVVTAGADVAPTVAAAAEQAGVPGIPVPVAERSHNKALVRQALHAAGLSSYQPRFNIYTDILDLIEDDSFVGYPCVVKPLQERASRGVTICEDYHYLPEALEKVQSYGTSFLIEQYLSGTEHSIEALFYDTHLLWFNIVDRFFDYTYSSPLELGHCNPTRLSMLQQQRLQLMLLSAAQALNITWGPFKIDCLWTADGPKILECTARMSGGWDCQGTSPMTGRYPLRTLLQIACQLPLEEIPPPHGYGVCATVLSPHEGVICALPVWHRSFVKDGLIDQVIWSVKVGETMESPKHCAERIGYVLGWGSDPSLAWDYVQQYALMLGTNIHVLPKEVL